MFEVGGDAGLGQGVRGRRQDACGLSNIDGTFYVTDDHAAASLADGMIEGDVIECCMHMGSFHIPTGKVMQPPCEVPLRTYQVVLKDENVFADLKRNAADEP